MIALVAMSTPALAAFGDANLTATVTPTLTPTEGDAITVTVTITNNLNTTLSNVQVIASQGSTEFGRFVVPTLRPGENFTGDISDTVRITNVLDNERGLLIQARNSQGNIFYAEMTIPGFKVLPKPPPPPVDYLTPAIIVGGGIGGVLVVFLVVRRKKLEAERIAAEAAAKAAVDARVKAEAAREAALMKKIAGKYPLEYYLRKRARLAILPPGGLTSAGVTVLQRKVILQKKIIFACPRCGTHKESQDAACPRCTVQDAADALKAQVRKHKGADLGDVGNLMQQAEFQLSYSSFDEAHDLIIQAQQVFKEIVAGGERTIKVKKLETITAAESHAKFLDLGLGTQHTVVDEAESEHDYEEREEYAHDSAHCPTCGHAMYGDLCAYCHFDEYAKLVGEAIASAAKVGADTVEPKDLLDRANKLREEGNKSSGSRYLNRARFLSKKHTQDYFVQKAEGMVDYARTLMIAGEEDGMTADFGEAERLLEEADAKRQAGDAENAIAVIARAEDSINAALHALAKRVVIRRIDALAGELDSARSKGVPVAAAEAKLQTARASFDGGEFERARDEVDEARKALVSAGSGKTTCPKCGKPVQPTWTKCPSCATPLK
jgi:tetratricopeptide (TPR) repeat protein